MNEKAFNQSGKNLSADDFLSAERQSTSRNELLGGKVVARSGSNRSHNLIVSNTAIALGSRMHGHKNELYVSNMRVKLNSKFVCYPDVVVVSGDPSFSDANDDLLLNPTIVVEIFSSETSTSDKTRKLENFLEMASIKECLLIKEDEMRVEHYARQNAKQWIYRIYNERDDVISLDSINCKVSMSEVYAQIKFKQAEFTSKAVN